MSDQIRAFLATATEASASTGQAVAPQGGIDYWEIATGSGLIVGSVLLLLVAASVASWAIIVRKAIQLRRARMQSIAFLDAFWQSKRLDALFQTAEELDASPVSQVFKAGYVELTKLTRDGETPTDADDIENVERALRRASSAELTHLESTTSFLATVGSAAPFVGLFGTVWGIMGAFHEIYMMGNANLATVAQPISEALIATAVGLFAAIPAVVAYNHFMAGVRVLEAEMHNFSIDFLNIIRRHFFKKKRQG
ncbi:MAG: protein TolQ [Deltaproteobacteria bacterium]|nr:protein TolQ [Deltaproteobacteria bacterium]